MRISLLLAPALTLALLLASPLQAEAPLPDANAFWAAARARYAPMFQTFAGTVTRSEQKIVRRSTKTGEIREQIRLILIVRDHYYQERTVEVVEYWKNGEKEDPKDYRDRGGKGPRHPILDAKGPEHYRVEMLGREQKHDRTCVVLKLIAREKSRKHLQGKLWFDEATHDLIAVDVRPSDMAFGVQAISAQVHFQPGGPVILPAGSVTRVMVHVPLIFPNNLLVIRDRPLETRGIPRG